jgi:hypothetical protein
VPDYKIDLLRPRVGVLDPLKEITSAGILDVAGVFSGNVRGVQSLCSLVPGLYYWGTIDGMHRAMAWERVLGRLYVPGDMLDVGRNSDLIRVSNEMTAESLERYKKNPKHEDLVWTGANDDIKVLQLGAGDWLSSGIEAVLSGILVAAWTAFETLVSDLWVAALNSRPKLGLIAIGGLIEKRDDDDRVEYEQTSKALSVTAKLLAENDYSLKGKMGTIAVEQRDFSKRAEAKKAWLAVFRKSEEELTKIFDDNSIRSLGTIRQTIVHANGIVTDKSLNRNPDLALIARDGKLCLDGEIVGQLANAAFEQGVALLRFTDTWMRRNPT